MSKFRLPALCLLLASPAFAVDPPHWASVNNYEDCDSACHSLHTSSGGALTQAAGNVNLCTSCHNDVGKASALPLDLADRATPGTSGTSHGFDVTAVNATWDTTVPANADMGLRIMSGNVVCSTCHDQHAADSSYGGAPRISPTELVTALGSTGTAASGGTYTGAGGAWYLLEIDSQGSQSSATFRWSKDNGTSWMATGVSAGNGSPVALDFGVTATFTGSGGTALRLGERWQFYASWPFLRAPLDSGDNTTGDKFCRDCHDNWVHDVTSVETYDGTKKSHPVGLPLGFGGRTYDRASPLDGNGSAQAPGDVDGNASNDLRLDSTNRVQCFTCHGVHYADSNTLTSAP